MNAALCWADVTKPAVGDDRIREVCGECLTREDSREERTPFLRRLTRGSVESALYSLEEARKQLVGAELSSTVEGIVTDAIRSLTVAKKEIEKAEGWRS